MKESRFLIENSLGEAITINVEPEGMFVDLGHDGEVEVVDRYEHAPVTIRVGRLDDGTLVVSVLPGDGDVSVLKDGKDVLR